jgi:hypothetical protein
MLECIRVLVNTPGWSPSYSIIFCALCPLFAVYFRVPRCPLLQYSTMLTNRYKTAHIYSRRSIPSLLREYPLPILLSLIIGTDTVTAPSVRAAINLEGSCNTAPISHLPNLSLCLASCWNDRPGPSFPSDVRTDDPSLLARLQE